MNVNENEYATFGLPGDPSNQPTQASAPVQPRPPRPRGWFLRNLWWLLPTAVLVMFLPCGCCGGIFVWVIGSLKSSEPYQMALERVRTNRQVIEKLGEPIQESSWMPTGNFEYHTINGAASGEANFGFSVKGPKGTAYVHAEARCREGKWAFRVLDVTPASTEKVISLPADRNAEKVPEP